MIFPCKVYTVPRNPSGNPRDQPPPEFVEDFEVTARDEDDAKEKVRLRFTNLGKTLRSINFSPMGDQIGLVVYTAKN